MIKNFEKWKLSEDISSDERQAAYDLLAKKLGKRKLWNEVSYTSGTGSRARKEVNWNAFWSLYARAAEQDHSLLTSKEVADEVLEKIPVGHVWGELSKPLELAREIYRKFPITQTEKNKSFYRAARNYDPKRKGNRELVDFFRDSAEEKYVRERATDWSPSGLWISADDTRGLHYLYDAGIINFDKTTPSSKWDPMNKSYYLPRLSSWGDEGRAIFDKVVTSPDFEYSTNFFEMMVKGNDRTIRKLVEVHKFLERMKKLGQLEKFKEYLLVTPGLEEPLDVSPRKSFLEAMNDEEFSSAYMTKHRGRLGGKRYGV